MFYPANYTARSPENNHMGDRLFAIKLFGKKPESILMRKLTNATIVTNASPTNVIKKSEIACIS